MRSLTSGSLCLAASPCFEFGSSASQVCWSLWDGEGLLAGRVKGIRMEGQRKRAIAVANACSVSHMCTANEATTQLSGQEAAFGT